MNEKHEIPAEMLDAATKAIVDLQAQIRLGLCSINDIAKAALEAAGVPALLAERDGLRFAHGELSEATMEAQAEARALRARVAELEELLKLWLPLATDAKCIRSVKWTSMRDATRRALRIEQPPSAARGSE